MKNIEVALEIKPPCLPLKLNWVPPGSFMMGNNVTIKEGTYNEPEGQFEVILSKGYWLGVYPITQCQWKALIGSDSSTHKGDDLPVEAVNWHDAIAYCEQLNKISIKPDGYIFSLPTEAQWEYACRAGTTYQYQLGDNANALLRVAWFSGNTQQHKTEKVGQKEPNMWGFYDMLGNVMEWCFDSYVDYPNGTSQIDWIGGTNEAFQNLRGGCVASQPVGDALTVSGRGYRHGSFGNKYTGFRVCLRYDVEAAKILNKTSENT